VLPGRLLVSRSFGDIEAKEKEFGGKKDVIIVQPEVCMVEIKPDFHDFLVIGCGGIFETLQNKDVLQTLWDTIKVNRRSEE
jgi:serine/threonine protein phosphatase PrpC